MKRYYYVSEDLTELEAVEKALENAGIEKSKMHVVSKDEANVDKKDLNGVSGFYKKDIIRAPMKGAVIGFIVALVILGTMWMMGVSNQVYWAIAIFASIVSLGFGTWEGGMWGLHKKNKDIEKISSYVDAGKHVLLLDVTAEKSDAVRSAISGFPTLKLISEDENVLVPAF